MPAPPGPDARQPVVVGAARVVRRDRSAPAVPPVDLAAEACRDALADAGVAAGDVDLLSVVEPVTWPYRDPGRAIGALLDRQDVRTVKSALGGTAPLTLLADAGRRVARGEVDAVLLCSGETLASLVRLQRSTGAMPDWPSQGEDVPVPEVLGDTRWGVDAEEQDVGLLAPPTTYSLLEDALRRTAGRSMAAQRRLAAELWSRLSAVAADDPSAWLRERLSPEALLDARTGGRPVTAHYPKLLTANSNVDMAAAVVVCSARRAAALGVPRDRTVAVAAVAEASDHWHVSERPDLSRSPALRVTASAALDAAGLRLDDVPHLDLYACFPSAVQIACRELDLPLDDPARPLSLTGGLTFGGGPANAPALHALARAVDVVRADGRPALVTGVGWFLTKHAAAVLTGSGAHTGFAAPQPQATVDALPRRERAPAVGSLRVDAATVVHRADGSLERAVVAASTPDGRRAWVTSTDGAVVAAAADGSLDVLDVPAPRG